MTTLVYIGDPYAGTLAQIGLDLHLKPCLGPTLELIHVVGPLDRAFDPWGASVTT
jgi:hypothetical protein